MPEVPEVYQMRLTVQEVIASFASQKLVVDEVIRPKRKFADRKMADDKVGKMQPNFKVAGYELSCCKSKNKEIALIFSHNAQIFCLHLKLALGAVLFWANNSDLTKDPPNSHQQEPIFTLLSKTPPKYWCCLIAPSLKIWQLGHVIYAMHFSPTKKLELSHTRCL